MSTPAHGSHRRRRLWVCFYLLAGATAFELGRGRNAFFTLFGLSPSLVVLFLVDLFPVRVGPNFLQSQLVAIGILPDGFRGQGRLPADYDGTIDSNDDEHFLGARTIPFAFAGFGSAGAVPGALTTTFLSTRGSSWLICLRNGSCLSMVTFVDSVASLTGLAGVGLAIDMLDGSDFWFVGRL